MTDWKLPAALGAAALGLAVEASNPEETEAGIFGPKSALWDTAEGQLGRSTFVPTKTEMNEFSDEALKILPGYENVTGPVPISSVVDNPEMVKHYPELWEEMKISRRPEEGSATGMWDETRKTMNIVPYRDDPAGTIAHETQHAIDYKEGRITAAGYPAMDMPETLVEKLLPAAKSKVTQMVNRDKDLLDKTMSFAEALTNLPGPDKVKFNEIAVSAQQQLKQQDRITTKARALYGNEPNQWPDDVKKTVLNYDMELYTKAGELSLLTGQPAEYFMQLKFQQAHNMVRDVRRVGEQTYVEHLQTKRLNSMLEGGDMQDVRKAVSELQDYDVYRHKEGEVFAFSQTERRQLSKADRMKTPINLNTENYLVNAKHVFKERAGKGVPLRNVVMGSGAALPLGAYLAMEQEEKRRQEREQGGEITPAYGPDELVAAVATGGATMWGKAAAGAVDLGVNSLMEGLPALKRREKGGAIEAGEPYLVGEKGPEIIVPQTSGTVIPFDPEGEGYDEATASTFIEEHPLTVPKPTEYVGPVVQNEDAYQAWVWHPELGDYKKHSGSLDPSTGMVLKGKLHPTWDLMEKEETRRGSKVIRKNGRYYSVPN